MGGAILRAEEGPDFEPETECHTPSQRAVDFVRALLSRSVRSRCTAEQALQNPFIVEHMSMSDGVVKEESSASLRAAIGKARQRTYEFDVPADPTEQRNIDEILVLL